MRLSGPGGARVLALLSAGTLVLGLVGPAPADVGDTRNCRKTLGKELGKLANAQLKNVDKCYKAQHKADAATAACNAINATFDPLGKYAAAVTKGDAKIDGKCLAGDPALDNYVPTKDPVADVLPAIQADLFGNSLLVAGNRDLGDPKVNKVDVKCNETIGKNRSKIFKEILKESSKCQDELDKTGTVFGALDSSCVKTAVKSGPKALDKITKDCVTAGASTDATGCFPLPACAIDAPVQSAQTTARLLYSNSASAGFVCGNDVVESPEQCDDGNTTSGDGCSGTCEIEGRNCDAVPGSTILGGRTVTVAVGGLIGGQKLAGIRVNLDYPQFQAGIAGTGQSSIVASKVAVVQGAPGSFLSIANDRDTDIAVAIAGTDNFIDNGDLLTFAMDACAAKELNVCNRNQNVMGCCDGGSDTDGDLNFQECVDVDAPPVCPTGSFPAASIGVPTVPPALEDCCPGDNACVTQIGATACQVTDAVDNNGLPIDGVTCTVSLAGI